MIIQSVSHHISMTEAVVTWPKSVPGVAYTSHLGPVQSAHLRTALLYVTTQRTDISGQPIGPIFRESRIVTPGDRFKS